MASYPLETLPRICLALPETSERRSHGEPTWLEREAAEAQAATEKPL